MAESPGEDAQSNKISHYRGQILPRKRKQKMKMDLTSSTELGRGNSASSAAFSSLRFQVTCIFESRIPKISVLATPELQTQLRNRSSLWAFDD